VQATRIAKAGQTHGKAPRHPNTSPYGLPCLLRPSGAVSGDVKGLSNRRIVVDEQAHRRQLVGGVDGDLFADAPLQLRGGGYLLSEERRSFGRAL